MELCIRQFYRVQNVGWGKEEEFQGTVGCEMEGQGGVQVCLTSLDAL